MTTVEVSTTQPQFAQSASRIADQPGAHVGDVRVHQGIIVICVEQHFVETLEHRLDLQKLDTLALDLLSKRTGLWRFASVCHGYDRHDILRVRRVAECGVKRGVGPMRIIVL